MTTEDEDKVSRIRAGDLVLYRATEPDFFQTAIMYTCSGDTHHVEVIERVGDHLRVGNAHVPAYTLDEFDDRLKAVADRKLKFIVMRWAAFHVEDEQEGSVFRKYQHDANLALQLWSEVPPVYDVMSIYIILKNIMKRGVRKRLPEGWFHRMTKKSLRNNERKLYCSELAEVICHVCGDFDMLEGLPSQTHSAPIHLERQLRRGQFKMIADFGNLSHLIFS